jgi:hypothetical protein
MDDYKEHGANIMVASTESMLGLQEKNATYFPVDLVFGCDQVDVYKWRQSLTNVQARYKAGRVFVDLETDEKLVVRGLYYDDANDDVVLYLNLVNNLTGGDIDKTLLIQGEQSVMTFLCLGRSKLRRNGECSGLEERFNSLQ